MENDKQTNDTPVVGLTGPTHGPQGTDKAPNEEVAEDTFQFEQQTHKGKKNDGDPELEEDKPIEQDELPETK